MATEVHMAELGFIETCSELWQLRSPFFPCKVGGKPAWLDLDDLPKSENLRCKVCAKPLVFLLQVYATLPELDASCFHRTLFVFCCRDGQCYQSNTNCCLAVFRSQLHRENKFYSSDPPPDLEEDSESMDEAREFYSEFERNQVENWTRLCCVCGCRGDKICSSCHCKRYCSKEHQKIDWVNGHKKACKQDTSQSHSSGTDLVLFPEFDLVTETEQYAEEEEERSEEERMRDYEKFLATSQVLDQSPSVDKDLESLATKGKESLLADKQFRQFRKRIAQQPEQVLRYDRGGTPLFVSGEHIPLPKDIPHCECGAERVFEFQILPQLLNYLKVDKVDQSVDWGTLIVYTCSKSCNSGAAYHQEFVWKQDFSDTDIPKNLFG